ncbi:MAG: hypothetical protein U0575_11190 [Phycisphaerales bacterium]
MEPFRWRGVAGSGDPRRVCFAGRDPAGGPKPAPQVPAAFLARLPRRQAPRRRGARPPRALFADDLVDDFAAGVAGFLDPAALTSSTRGDAARPRPALAARRALRRRASRLGEEHLVGEVEPVRVPPVATNHLYEPVHQRCVVDLDRQLAPGRRSCPARLIEPTMNRSSSSSIFACGEAP